MSKDEKTVQQAAALVWRPNGKSLQVLLVTSRDSRRWVPPKGHIEPGLSAARSAEMEAYEEAGVKGKVSSDCVGTYTSIKPANKGGNTCSIQVFPLKATKELKVWPESKQRKRRWVAPEDAALMVDEIDLKSIILDWAKSKKG